MRYNSFLFLITLLAIGIFVSSCNTRAAKPTATLPFATLTSLPPTATITPTSTALPPTPTLTTGKLEGRVFRSDTGDPIFNAEVTLFMVLEDGTSKDLVKVQSDKQGLYTFVDIEPGYYHVNVLLRLNTQTDIDESPCLMLPGSSTVTRSGTWITMGIQSDGVFFLDAIESIDVKAGDIIKRDIDLNCHSE